MVISDLVQQDTVFLKKVGVGGLTNTEIYSITFKIFKYKTFHFKLRFFWYRPLKEMLFFPLNVFFFYLLNLNICCLVVSFLNS